ncbi:MAG: tyrosine-type recombinase/integrase [Pseudomonadota bacterium]
MAAANSIDSPTKRNKLTPKREPYWQKITAGQYLGFRRTKTGGSWVARVRVNDQQRYQVLDVPEAWDDKAAYDIAVSKALEWFTTAATVEDHHYRVKNAVSNYVEHLRVNNSEAAAKDAESRLDNHLTDKLKDCQLTQLKTVQLKRWHQDLVRVSDDDEDVRRSKDGANKLLTKLKAALNLAFNNGLVATDREWRRVKPFKDVGGVRILFLTDKQVKRLLEKSDGAFKNLLEAAKLTGARYGELTNILVADLDAKHGTLSLDGKTGARLCYLSDEALTWFKQQAKDKLPKALLLPKDDGMVWGKSHQARPMKAVVKAAKLPRETVFYSLRHYHISKALLAGVPAQVVAENCGTSIRMIEKHYGKFMAQDRRAFFNQVVL